MPFGTIALANGYLEDPPVGAEVEAVIAEVEELLSDKR
jgi:hypothetical protein